MTDITEQINFLRKTQEVLKSGDHELQVTHYKIIEDRIQRLESTVSMDTVRKISKDLNQKP